MSNDLLALSDARLAITAAALIRQFGGRAAVSPGEALQVVGGAATADPERAATQRMNRATFPFHVTQIGRRNVVLLADIAHALCYPDESGTEKCARRREPPKQKAPEKGKRKGAGDQG